MTEKDTPNRVGDDSVSKTSLKELTTDSLHFLLLCMFNNLHFCNRSLISLGPSKVSKTWVQDFQVQQPGQSWLTWAVAYPRHCSSGMPICIVECCPLSIEAGTTFSRAAVTAWKRSYYQTLGIYSQKEGMKWVIGCSPLIPDTLWYFLSTYLYFCPSGTWLNMQ